MANKVYTVMKDGELLETLKTLPAARKLAEAEGAEVYLEGKCVYPVQGEATEEAAPTGEQTIINADPVVAKKPVQPETPSVATEQYRLKKLMNVRSKPSMDARIVATKPAGTLVRVRSIENDWLHLADGNYILYQDGEFAEKA